MPKGAALADICYLPSLNGDRSKRPRAKKFARLARDSFSNRERLFADASCDIDSLRLLPRRFVLPRMFATSRLGLRRSTAPYRVAGLDRSAHLWGIAAGPPASARPEQVKTAIFASNYGEASAVDFFGPRYGHAHIHCHSPELFFVGPHDYTGEIAIRIGTKPEDALDSYEP